MINNNTNKCKLCGIELSRATHIEEVGKVRVVCGTVSYCASCGEGSAEGGMLLDVLHKFELDAAMRVLLDGSCVDGAVIKYARKALGLKKKELARRLCCSADDVSQWESDIVPTPRSKQLFLLAFLQEKSEQLISEYTKILVAVRGGGLTVEDVVFAAKRGELWDVSTHIGGTLIEANSEREALHEVAALVCDKESALHPDGREAWALEQGWTAERISINEPQPSPFLPY